MDPEGKVQRSQKAVLENIRDEKDFDFITRNRELSGQNRQQIEGVKEKEVIENCKYCGMTHPQKQCQAYGICAADMERLTTTK